MRLMRITVDGVTHVVDVYGNDSEALHDFLVTHDPADYIVAFTDYVPKIDFDTNMADFDRLSRSAATREAELEAAIRGLHEEVMLLAGRVANINRHYTEALEESGAHRRRLVKVLAEQFMKAIGNKSVVAGWREDRLRKIEVIKNLREMMPELGLAECKWMAEHLGF